MKPSAFIASRLRFKGGLAVAATAISFFVMIVASAISGGFRSEIHKGVGSWFGDIRLSHAGSDPVGAQTPLKADSASIAELLSLKEVKAVEGVVLRAGIVQHEGTIQGILVKGEQDSGLGNLEVSIPEELSRRLGLGVGDEMLTYFVGEKVQARRFKVAAVHGGIVLSDDYPEVIARIEDMRRLSGWKEDESSALLVTLKDGWNTDRGISQAAWDVGTHTDLVAETLPGKYPQLFGWLQLVDFNVLMILLLMTAVAGFNMISGLLIMLFRNISTIGTLKSLGMSNRGITGVFLRVSSRITLMGMAIGNGLALLFCAVQGWTHLLKLNPENYFVSFVPVAVNLPSILLTDVAAYALIMLMMLLPTLFIARVDPARTVRTE